MHNLNVKNYVKIWLDNDENSLLKQILTLNKTDQGFKLVHFYDSSLLKPGTKESLEKQCKEKNISIQDISEIIKDNSKNTELEKKLINHYQQFIDQANKTPNAQAKTDYLRSAALVIRLISAVYQQGIYINCETIPKLSKNKLDLVETKEKVLIDFGSAIIANTTQHLPLVNNDTLAIVDVRTISITLQQIQQKICYNACEKLSMSTDLLTQLESGKVQPSERFILSLLAKLADNCTLAALKEKIIQLIPETYQPNSDQTLALSQLILATDKIVATDNIFASDDDVKETHSQAEKQLKKYLQPLLTEHFLPSRILVGLAHLTGERFVYFFMRQMLALLLKKVTDYALGQEAILSALAINIEPNKQKLTAFSIKNDPEIADITPSTHNHSLGLIIEEANRGHIASSWSAFVSDNTNKELKITVVDQEKFYHEILSHQKKIEQDTNSLLGFFTPHRSSQRRDKLLFLDRLLKKFDQEKIKTGVYEFKDASLDDIIDENPTDCRVLRREDIFAGFFSHKTEKIWEKFVSLADKQEEMEQKAFISKQLV